MSNNVMLLTLIASAIMMCMLLVYSFLYRHQRGVRYFAWIMVCRVVYGGGVILELYNETLPAKLLFRHVEQTGLVTMVPLIILCVLDVYGRDEWLKPNRQALLFSVSAVWVVLVWTDPYTRLVHSSVTLADGHLMVEKSNLTISFNLICYLALIVCFYAFMVYAWRARPETRKPGIAVVLLGSSSFGVELLKLAYPDLTPWLLPISVYCSVFGLAMLWIILKINLFSIIPMARSFIVDTIREGILTVDERGRVVDSNAFILPLLGEPGDGSPLGRDVRELLASWPQWRDACLGRQEQSLEIAGSGGERLSFIVKVYPLLSRRGRSLGAVSIAFDVTEQQRRLESIARLNRMKDQLFTLVSHDIRQPLATQVGLIEWLEREQEGLNPSQLQLVELLSAQARSTYLTVDNVLEWFRGQREDVQLRLETVPLAELVHEAYRLLAVQCEAKQVRIERQIDPGLRVAADRETIVMVLRNLLSNAIKYSSRGGRVDVAAARSDGRVVVTVRDSGTGMDAARLRAIGEELWSPSSAGTEGERGTGLGLAISRRFLAMHGSELGASSEPGEGSAFYFSLREGDADEGDDCG